MGSGSAGEIRASLRILSNHWNQMLLHVSAEHPLEACGIIAGVEDSSVHVYEVENSLKSPVRFLMTPKQQVEALVDIEAQGWDLLAIYHSHPDGPAWPSPTDVAEAYYPEAAHLIWSHSNGEWSCRAFQIEGSEISEISVEIAGLE